MKTIKSAVRQVLFVGKTILAPAAWMVFWISFAIVATPFQIVYHLFSFRKSSHKTFDRGYEENNFNQSIALIEMHKIRFGDYPKTLYDKTFRQFLSSQDKRIAHTSVMYYKRENGYELHLNSQDAIQLEYPTEFWNGLGLVETNVKGFKPPS